MDGIADTAIDLAFTVNGEATRLRCQPSTRLSDLLREQFGLRGTKVGCNAGDCGACTVLLDGRPVCACLVPAGQVEGRYVETAESLAGPDSALSGLQQAFLRHGAAQCGICTPGMMMAATALLRDTPSPDRNQVEDAIGGVLCRCTGYDKIVDAIMEAGTAATSAPAPGAGAAVGAAVQRLDGHAKVNAS